MGTVGPSGVKIPGMVPRWLILRLGIVKARAIRTPPNRNQGVHKACTFAHRAVRLSDDKTRLGWRCAKQVGYPSGCILPLRPQPCTLGTSPIPLHFLMPARWA